MSNNITFSSDLNNLNIAEAIVDTISRVSKLDELIYGNILLSLSEAINNAIVHGNKFNRNKKVSVCYKFIEKKNLLITVEDEGNGFDPSKISDPTDPDNLENLYGRGVFLINNLADEVKYEENGKKVLMNFQLN